MGDIITVMNLGWQYASPRNGDSPAGGLHNVGCYVQRGAFAGVIGPTGSGKTTFVKTLVGIIPHCTRGTLTGYVRIADMNVKSTSVSDLSVRVGYVGQNPITQITNATVEEEIAFPLENRGVEPDEIHERVEEVLAMLHVKGLRHRLLQTLSYGELERVLIGAALAAEPDVLILDEPLGNLDAEGCTDLMNAIAAMHERTRMTTILVEQDTRVLEKYADAVFLMVNGEIIRRTTADIFTRERALLESVGVRVNTGQSPELVIEDDEPGQADNPSVIVDHVHFTYPDSVEQQPPQLNNVAFAVEQGAFIGIVGPTGAGKSTLLRMLNAQLRPTAGTVFVNGVNVASRTPTQMAQLVAYVPQDLTNMFCYGTVREQIAFGPHALGIAEEEAGKRVNELIRQFDLFDIEDLPVRSLSSGEQRAVALACALAMHPSILLLDEPIAGLDNRLQLRFLNTVAQLNKEGVTVVMVCNDASIIQRYCSHAARLDAGQLISYGRVQQLSIDSAHTEIHKGEES